MKIYFASKTKHADKWKALRAAGVQVISTWIDEAGEGESADVPDLAMRCIHEATNCGALIAYAEPGETMKGSLIEIGAALASCRLVIAVGPVISDTSAFRQHPFWDEASSIEAALEMLNIKASAA